MFQLPRQLLNVSLPFLALQENRTASPDLSSFGARRRSNSSTTKDLKPVKQPVNPASSFDFNFLSA